MSTKVFYDPSKDRLFVGFDDGKVVCFEVMSIDDKQEKENNVVHANDFVLCPVSDVLKYETELKNPDVQSNLIRDKAPVLLTKESRARTPRVFAKNSNRGARTNEGNGRAL